MPPHARRRDGGFKATPGSGWTFAWTIAHDEPHPLNSPFTLDRFTSGALIECATIGCMPELDYATWGQAFAYCEGARLRWDGRWIDAEALRVPGAPLIT